MSNKRQRGVKNFWKQEIARLKNGQNGTRNWNAQQKAR